MNYALECKEEFDRLERQSKLFGYDYKEELRYLKIKPGSLVIDAGCGSGVVSRFVAQTNPQSQFVGCDRATERLALAKTAAQKIPNLTFKETDLRTLPFADKTVDVIFSRYVFQHLPPEIIDDVLQEFRRCLKDDGILYLIDFDGGIYNIFPLEEPLTSQLKKVEMQIEFDLYIGRKLPTMLAKEGFTNIQWKIDTFDFHGENLDKERAMMKDRFDNMREALINILGSEKEAAEFQSGYLKALEKSHSVLFYNKFLISATRGSK